MVAFVGLEVFELVLEVIHLGAVAVLPSLIELSLELGEMGIDGLQGGGLSGTSQLRAAALASIPPFGGNSPAPGIACQSGLNPWPRVIRRYRLKTLALMCPLVAAALLGGCGPDPRTLAQRQRLADQQRLLRLCQQIRPRLRVLLPPFEAAERDHTQVRAATYVATPGPKPLDPNEQRRLTLEDQQTEQALHDQAVEAWSRAEAERRGRWEQQQAAQEQEALQALAQAAVPLRQLHPQLLLPGTPPRLNTTEVMRFRDCSAERFR